ncbi:PEP-utilizing enzyme [Candidatus Pelagibacter sp.]|nr:PEP-utilizing enzyme [Candidatus Pelagibacter sp.]
MKHTKSSSLKFISNKISKKLVPKFYLFTKREYLENKKKIIKKIKINFPQNIILRSSALDEDGENFSNAGKYDSYILKRNQFNELEKKIDLLIGKFKKKNDEVIVQKLIETPDISGVIFTKDKNTNSHYYEINFDISKRTDLITSGRYNPSIKSLIIFKASKKIPKKFKKLINILKELEAKFNNDRLDIEFCIKKNKIYILQCRPLLGTRRKKISIEKIKDIIVNQEKKFNKINSKTDNLSGKYTMLSNMADWNPAEMIGVKPYKLASSLYSTLITNNVWSLQRVNYGYKDVRPNILMLDISGNTYIDIRTDLNSFLPKHLEAKICEKIVNNSIKKLKKNPELHDKLEFSIIDTCYNLSLSKKKYNYLSKSEQESFFDLLRKLTNKIIDNNFLENDLDKINLLNKKIIKLKKSNLSHIQKIYFLIDDCKKLGTLAFAGVARCAFISKSIFDSLLNEKLISHKKLNEFYLSINTISKDINNEYIKSFRKKNFNNFISKYGHLRPSTYSISIENYNKNFKNYFSKDIKNLSLKKTKKFKISNKSINLINKHFKKNNLSFDFKRFLNFAKKSIEQREFTKLIFSKSINEIFVNLKLLAKETNLNFKNFEHLDINLILKSYSSLEQEKLKNLLIKNINSNRKSYNFSKNLKMPDVISKISDFSYFYEDIKKGNYVTEKQISGDVVLYNKDLILEKLNNKIILIENADPGYDFLFSYNLKGLITKYGGANSHMAIRCMELDLPSIIGIGDRAYNLFSKSKKIYVDCFNKKFEIIH